MVQMRNLPSSSIAVTVEIDGGIRNPACQDVVDEGYYRSIRNSQEIVIPNNNSTEQLTDQSTDDKAEAPEVAGTIDSTAGATQSAREKIMNACRSIMHYGLLIDALIFISVALLLAVIEFGVLPHQSIGFYCNDPKISFKFTGDTISIGVLIAASIVIPLVVMWSIEWACHSSDSYRPGSGCTGSRARQVWSWYGHYSVGLIAVTFVCDIIKIVIGEPRPHFFDTCRPRELHNCTDDYVYLYTCTNTNDSLWFVSDSSKSFPSGHSAISMFTTIYLVWYIQNRLPARVSTMFLKPLLQCLAVLWGSTCSLTRIRDNRHHWWDVLAGASMGVAFAVFSVKLFCRDFHIRDSGVSRAVLIGEPIENGHIFDDKRHQSVRKLLSNTSVDISEGRELRDVGTTWKE